MFNNLIQDQKSNADVAFIISKPIQFLISLAIINDYYSGISVDFLVIDDFCDAYKFSYSIGLSEHNNSINHAIYCIDHYEAFRKLKNKKYTTIFMDSDVGFVRHLQFIKYKLTSNARINIFEEGLGTYRNNLYGHIKKFTLKIIGVGTHFGGSIFSNEIYLYNVDAYKLIFGNCIIIKQINTGIDSIIKKRKNLLYDLFGLANYKELLNIANQDKCTVYLSSWGIDYTTIKLLAGLDDTFYIKLHPNIKIVSKNLLEYEKFIIPHSIPAEILLGHLSDIFKEVLVFHHGSSVVNYINRKNILYKKI